MSRMPLLVLSLTLVVAGAGAATFDVNTTIDTTDPNPGDGVCGAMLQCSLRQAVQEANALAGADTIVLPAGTYTLTLPGIDEDRALTGDLDVTDDLDIVGVGPAETIVDAAGIDRVFHVPYQPGGVGCELTLRGITITGGSAVTATSFTGGGILVEASGKLAMTTCTISGNVANQGGGVSLSNATADIRYSTLSGNSTQNSGFTNDIGAAIFANYSNMLLLASTVSDNSSEGPSEGALNLAYGDIGIVNSTIASNEDGGVTLWGCDLSLFHATITGNGARGVDFGSPSGTKALTIRNSILADNSVFDCYITSGVYTHVSNLDSDGTCSLDAASGELPLTDPQLGALGWNGGPTMTRQPNAGSPVIDAAADPQVCSPVDQRGVPRPEDADGDYVSVCDIGAVEVAMLIFADGFESGATWAWERVVQ